MFSVRITTLKGRTNDFFESNILDIVDYAYENSEDYPFLSSIDYYGVTYFSYQQITERVIPELLKISKNVEFKEKIEKLIEYINNMDYHIFLQIIGD